MLADNSYTFVIKYRFELHIQLRNIYFDRIERSKVEELIRVIFDAVKSLDDMIFFVKYMVQVCRLTAHPSIELADIMRWSDYA